MALEKAAMRLFHSLGDESGGGRRRSRSPRQQQQQQLRGGERVEKGKSKEKRNSKGEDPRTFEENSKGKDPSTSSTWALCVRNGCMKRRW